MPALDAEEMLYLHQFSLVQSSVFSGIEGAIADIRKATSLLSFDYSDRRDLECIGETALQLHIAFLSESGFAVEKYREVMLIVAGHGVGQVIGTCGSLGALAFAKGEFYEQGIAESEVVDTLGAGDGFISAYVTTA